MKLAQYRQLRFSLAFRYSATIIVLMLIGLGLLITTMIYSQIKQNDRYIEDFGSIITTQLAAAAMEPLFTKQTLELQSLVNSFSLDKYVVTAAIYDINEEKIVSKGILPSGEELHFDESYYKLGKTHYFDYRFERVLSVHVVPISFQEVKAGYALVVFANDLMDEQFKQQLYLIIMTFSIILFAVVVAGFIIGKNLTKPIKSIVAATESIKEGKLDLIYDRRSDELGTLIDAINNMSQGLIRKAQVETMLDRVLTKDVKHKVMDQLDTFEMAGEHVYATVLFADIVGFTSISEKISPEEVQKLLNEYYSYFNACARFFFGTVDKYIGDCVMVVFGATKADPLHEYHAVACANMMQKLAEQLNIRREKQGEYPIELRIGINSGKMVAGLIGSSDRMEYTVVGDAVNLASRLCSEAEGSQTIIEESLYNAVNPEHKMTVEAHKEIRVRGKEESVKIYSVLNIEHANKVAMDDLITDILSTKNV